MRDYNGFSAAQRVKALAWLKAEVAAGRRQLPKQCDGCGRTDGVEPHSEDYSEPFGDHIGAYGLCRTCHSGLHRQTAPGPVNLLTGETLPRRRSYATDPIRKVDGDPVKAARKAAKKAAAALRTTHQAVADRPAEAPKFRAGAQRSNKGLAGVLAALTAAEGATLAECTKLSGWAAPFELRNLRILAKKNALTVAVASGEGDARRFRLTTEG